MNKQSQTWINGHKHEIHCDIAGVH